MPSISHPELHDFATRYTAAWCSQHPASVASFYAPDGRLAINGGEPAIGRAAIAASAESFMIAFPDLMVFMDGLEAVGDRMRYRWTLTGTNTGPGGAGRTVRISGHEDWMMSEDGLVADSIGWFDADDYQRQLGG